MLLFAGCGDDDHEAATSTTAEPSAPAAEPGGPNAGGLTWDAPEPFRAQRPSMDMRAAEYVFPEEPGEEAATLTVYFFGRGRGGSIDENINRWVGQLRQPDGSDSRQAADISTREVSGMQVTIVDVTGTYSGGMGMQRGAPRDNQRMLAAIAEGPEGPVFFKMVGDATLMTRAEAPFNTLVSSLRPT